MCGNETIVAVNDTVKETKSVHLRALVRKLLTRRYSAPDNRNNANQQAINVNAPNCMRLSASSASSAASCAPHTSKYPTRTDVKQPTYPCASRTCARLSASSASSAASCAASARSTLALRVRQRRSPSSCLMLRPGAEKEPLCQLLFMVFDAET